MTLPDLTVIVAVALGCALAVGLLGIGLLHLLRHRSLRTRIVVASTVGIVSVVAGMVAIAQAMYLSRHDLVVSMYVAAAAALGSIAVAYVLARGISRESRRVRDMARRLGAGDVVEETAAPGGSEFAGLAAELSETSRKLEAARAEVAALDSSRRELVAWISHDLRTPLAGLLAMAEALEDGMAPDVDRFHAQMRSQVDHLTAMVEDLFELSKIQSGTLRLSPTTVSLYDLVSDAASSMAPVAEARGVTIREAGGPGPLVDGDPTELARVVENLLMNALTHASPGTAIELSTSQDSSGRAVLHVSDEAGGIPEADLAHVFTTGWRGTPSRTPEPRVGRSSSAGLGLAIVKGIVEAHDGEVSVRNTRLGARFSIVLPAHDPA